MHLATRLPCLLLALSLGTVARAQKSAPAANPDAQLLLDLGSDDKCVDAVRTLTHRGEKGVATLMAAIRDPGFHADERRLATAVYALGKLGDAAAPAAQLLLDETVSARGDVLRNLYWALGEIGPRAQVDGVDVLRQLRGVTAHLRGWESQEWTFACRRVELGVVPEPALLAELLNLRDHASLIAAAALLRRVPVGNPIPQEELRAAWRRCERDWRQAGEAYKRVALELARAVVLHLPDPPDGVIARTALIYHFDVEVRLQAVMELGQSTGGDATIVVKALQESLTDGNLQVRREAVTALGMLGPPADGALPALQQLTSDPDLQLRSRAAAAVRAIGRTDK